MMNQVQCSWCDAWLPDDEIKLDDSGEIICKKCYGGSVEDTLAMSHDQYVEELHLADGDLTPEQLEQEWIKLEQFRATRHGEVKES